MMPLYFSSPVGCNAGAMPWDNSCNKDHDDIVLRHVAATTLLDKDDPKKFSLATPDTIISAYTRCYEGIPAHRLGEDIVKTGDYFLQVAQNQGLNINVVGGDRNNKGRGPNEKSRRGGIRVKKEEADESKWCHEDAKDSMKNFFKGSNDRFLDKLSEFRKKSPVFTADPQACMDPDGVIRDEEENDTTMPLTTPVSAAAPVVDLAAAPVVDPDGVPTPTTPVVDPDGAPTPSVVK